MKKSIVIAGVAVVILAGIGTAISLGRDSNSPTSQSTTADSTQNSGQSATQTNGANTFNPVSTSDISFIARLTSKDDSGTTTTGSLEYDQKSGNMRFSTTVEGQDSELIYTSDAYYICNAGTCYKTALGQGNTAGFDRENYEFSQEEIERFRNLASSQGTESCPAGTCEVWEITESDTSQTLIYIDTKTNYISQVKNSTGTSNNTIVYEYTDVTVTPPSNAQELPALQGIGN